MLVGRRVVMLNEVIRISGQERLRRAGEGCEMSARPGDLGSTAV